MLSQHALILALATLRISVAFATLPLFNRESIPPLVRGSLFVSLALISIVTQPAGSITQLDSSIWLNLFLKEALVGLCLGIFFGLFLWAFEAAGVIIDMQIGASFGLFFDPLIGNEVTLTGSFLSRLAGYLFVASGGLLLLSGALLESFNLWPIAEPVASFRVASVRLFEAEYSHFFSLAMRIAGPIIVVLFIIDVCMGLVNRYAQQFNVFFLSMSIKSIATILMMIILLPYLVDVLVHELSLASASWESNLKSILNTN